MIKIVEGKEWYFLVDMSTYNPRLMRDAEGVIMAYNSIEEARYDVKFFGGDFKIVTIVAKVNKKKESKKKLKGADDFDFLYSRNYR